MKIYSKGGVVLADVSDYPYSGVFMGERFVSSSFKTDSPIDFLAGDYLTYRGESFVLDYTPTAKKISSAGSTGDAFQYDLKFVSLKHETEKCMFLDVVLNDNEIHYTGLSEVSFFGDATMLAHRILANLNRLYKGEQQWQIEVIGESEAQNISLSDSNCWDAISLFKSQLGLNFIFKGRKVTVGTVGKLIDHVFKYGSGNGLTEITRTAVSENAVVTRLRAYGGERNLPRDYNKTGLVPESQYIKSLMLPNYTTTLIDYIDSENIPIYGIREAVFKDENIYPSIHGVTADDLRAAGVTTTATGRVDEIVAMEAIKRGDQATFNVWIKDIGFDIKKYLTPTTALLSMRDGNLGGYEFEIVNVIKDSSVAGAAYKLTLNRNQDDNFILPDIKTFVKPGDHFVLLEIYMPDVYVKTAEQRLLTKAKEYLTEYDHVKATYSINLDKVFMAYHPTIGDTIYEGDLIRVVDEDLKLDREIIIQNLNIKTADSVPTYEVTLSDNPVATTLDRVQDNISEIEQNVTANKIDGIKEARRRAIELQLLKANIFDPDGMIADVFLQTMFLQVGADSMSYQMDKTSYFNGVASNMSFTNTSISFGVDNLKHFSYGAGNEKASTWRIETPFSASNLDTEKIYFVAIKASRDNLSAEWIVSESSYSTESFNGYYIFNFGILYGLNDGKRIFTETRGLVAAYGSSVIAGRFTTMDGYSYWDMENGNFQIYNKKTGQGFQFKDGVLTLGTFNPETGKFSSSITKIENDITNASEKADSAYTLSETVNNSVNDILTVMIPDIQNQIDGSIASWDGEVVPTLVNYPANQWTTTAEKDRHISDTYDYYFTQDGEKVSKRYKFRKQANVYAWELLADSDAARLEVELRKTLGIANSKNSIRYGARPTPPYSIDDIWIDSSKTMYVCKVQRLEGATGLVSDWEIVNDTQVRLSNMASDGVISKEEKPNYRNTLSQIQKEYDSYNAIATTVSKTALTAAYNNIIAYMTNTYKVNDVSDTQVSEAQRNQFNTYLAAWYSTVTDFTNLIAGEKADGAVSNIKIGGVNYLNNPKNIEDAGNKYNEIYIDKEFLSNYNRRGEFVLSFFATAVNFTSSSRSELFVRLSAGLGIFDIQVPIDFIGTYENKRFEIKFGTNGSKYTNIEIAYIITLGTLDSLLLSDIMIEPGNKASASWFPSLDKQKSQIEEIAQAKAEAERIKAEAYADGIVTIEEERAIADTQAKYNAVILEAERIAQLKADKGKLFLRGTGYNNNVENILTINNGINIAIGSRGLNLITIKRSDLSIIENISYDTYGNSENQVALLANKLDNLNSDVIVTLTSCDSAYYILNDNIPLLTAIARCGGSGSTNLVSARTPYAFVGIPGIGKGNGIEVYTSNDANAPFAEISTQIINGVPSSFNGVAKNIADGKPNTFTQSTIPGSARKNDTWYSGETQEASLYTYACISTYTSGGTMANWMLAADNSKTTIENGLVTTGTVYLQGGSTTDKLQVRAGISGSGESEDSVRFWSGGTLSEANSLVNNTPGTKATFAVDGRGELFATKANISGEVNAITGNIGGFKISGQALNAFSGGVEKIRLSNEPIGNLSGLSGADQYIGGAKRSDISAFFSISVQKRSRTVNLGTFILTGTKKVKFYSKKETTIPSSSFSNDFNIKNSYGTSVYKSAENVFETNALPSGTYTIDVLLTLSLRVNVGQQFASGTIVSDGCFIESGAEQTKIGNNGFFSYFSPSAYVYFNPDYGFEFRFLNGGIRSTGSGLQKWNGSSWINL